jgi:hypothetical protein
VQIALIGWPFRQAASHEHVICFFPFGLRVRNINARALQRHTYRNVSRIACSRCRLWTFVMAGDGGELERVAHHVFLPSKLPQQTEDESSSDIALVDITLKALSSLRDLVPSTSSSSAALSNAVAVITSIRAVNSLSGGSPSPNEAALQKALAALPIGQTLAAHIGAQNAAVLITRRPADLVFEAFELAPQNEAVIKT